MKREHHPIMRIICKKAPLGQVVFTLALMVMIAGCSPWANWQTEQAIDVAISQQTLKLRAPKGYCFARPSLQKRRGFVHPEAEYGEVMATPCIRVKGKEIMLVYSFTPNDAAIEKQVMVLKNYPGIKIETTSKGYRFNLPIASRKSAGLFFVLNDYLVMLRAIGLDEVDSSRLTLILDDAHETLRAAN